MTLSGGLLLRRGDCRLRYLFDSARGATSDCSRLDPRVGVDINARARACRFFASLGVVRAPSLIEVWPVATGEPCVLPYALGDDPPIAPVTVTTFETGARYQSGHLSLTSTAYYGDVVTSTSFHRRVKWRARRSRILRQHPEDAARRPRPPAGRYAFGEAHSVYANYAYTRACFQSQARSSRCSRTSASKRD